MNNNAEIKNNIKTLNFIEKIKNSKKIQMIIIAIIIVILVLVVSLNLIDQNENNNLNNADEIALYVDNLEDRLSSALSKVDGAGNVSVVITVSSGMETVIAMTTTTKNTSSGTEVVETPLLVNGKTVVLKELYPKITGVLIVAEGAKNISVLTKIQQAAVSLLDININQIEILTMK